MCTYSYATIEKINNVLTDDKKIIALGDYINPEKLKNFVIMLMSQELDMIIEDKNIYFKDLENHNSGSIWAYETIAKFNKYYNNFVIEKLLHYYNDISEYIFDDISAVIKYTNNFLGSADFITIRKIITAFIEIEAEDRPAFDPNNDAE